VTAIHPPAVAPNNNLPHNPGAEPTATYQPLGFPMILLPLGSEGGVGQLPSPEGPFVAPTEMVSQFKGQDLFTGRFVGQLGPTAA
ncbi:FAD-dependent oxidoreductase, partial [Streptomyces sp. NPDC059627]